MSDERPENRADGGASIGDRSVQDPAGLYAEAAHAAGLYTDEWWIEHVEGEAADSLEEDLGLLLRNSRADRAKRAIWLRARQAIKNADDVALPESGAEYDRMHDAIMAGLEGVGIEPAPAGPEPLIFPFPRFRKAQALRRLRMASSGAFVSFAAIAIFIASLASTLVSREGGGTPAALAGSDEPSSEERLGRRLAFATARQPGAFVDTVLGYQLEADVLIEAAERRLDSLDPIDAEKILEALRRR